MKFKWDLILKDNTCIHCETKQEALIILGEADKKGLRWANGSSYLKYDFWGKSLVYYFKTGYHGDYQVALSENKTILKYKNILIKPKIKIKFLGDM